MTEPTAGGPSPEMRRYVDGEYLAHNPDWSELHAVWKANQVLRMLTRHRIVPQSVCDIGCGTGGVLAGLAGGVPPTTRLVGYDVSAAAIDLAPAARRQRIEFCRADTIDPESHFELALMMDVFEHVGDYLGFLRRLSRTADHYIFHIPLDISVQSVLRVSPLLRARGEVGHLHYFLAETALATLDTAGYRLVDQFYTLAGSEAPGLSFRSRLAAIPRKLAFSINEALAARVLGGFSLLVLAEGASAKAGSFS